MKAPARRRQHASSTKHRIRHVGRERHHSVFKENGLSIAQDIAYSATHRRAEPVLSSRTRSGRGDHGQLYLRRDPLCQDMQALDYKPPMMMATTRASPILAAQDGRQTGAGHLQPLVLRHRTSGIADFSDQRDVQEKSVTISTIPRHADAGFFVLCDAIDAPARPSPTRSRRAEGDHLKPDQLIMGTRA